MKNILLMMPIRGKNSKNVFYSPDLGLGYLATALREKMSDAFHISILIDHLNLSDEDFASYLTKGNFDVIGIKVFSVTVWAANRTITIIRKSLPRAKVVIGGPQVTGDPENVLNYIPADYGIAGEGELGLPKLLSSFTENGVLRNADAIPGLIWKQDGTVKHNPPAVIEDIDSVGMVAWDLMDPRNFPCQELSGFTVMDTVAPIITSRGCRYKCTFCQAANTRWRERSVVKVMEEMALLYNRYDVREFSVLDNGCGYRDEYIIKFAKALIDSNLPVRWTATGGFRVDLINREMLDYLKRSHCYRIGIGIESGSNRILKKIQKGITTEAVSEKIKLINDAGLDVVGYFMLGIPGETKEDIRKTLDLAMKLKLQGAVFSIYSPIPGTEIYRELKEKGFLESVDFNSLDQKYYKNNFTEYTPEELIRIRIRAYWQFHLRPRILIRNLKVLISPKRLLFLGKYLYWHLYLGRRSW